MTESEYISRLAKIEAARASFFSFCQILGEDFYLPERTYLVKLCNTLQELYEGKLVNELGTPFRKLMLNIPPQHGKSRTLVNFTAWLLGKSSAEKIITASYNDNVAADFSKFTRDLISRKANDSELVYSDIFPETRIKKGDASKSKWALEGRHFSYLGCGIGGSLTSRGGSVLIIDDPVKGSYEAFNSSELDRIWSWYTGTFLSRVSAKKGEPLEIVNMTRWAKGDLCGRLLETKNAEDWHILKLEAQNDGEMLCNEVLSKSRYEYLSETMDKGIFLANYHQQPVDLSETLYENFLTYRSAELPEAFEKIIAYIDTADTGSDSLCMIIAGICEKKAYVLDVYFTRESMEITEKECAIRLSEQDVNLALIESNNGGRAFARNVRELLRAHHLRADIAVKWFHQSRNKEARILTASADVMRKILFPEGFESLWKEFHRELSGYAKGAKNTHDDAADATTGLAEMLSGGI